MATYMDHTDMCCAVFRIEAVAWLQKYETDSRSALKAAEQFGRFEGGEVVTVTNKSGKVLDKAVYTPEDGGKYLKVNI